MELSLSKIIVKSIFIYNKFNCIEQKTEIQEYSYYYKMEICYIQKDELQIEQIISIRIRYTEIV